VPKRARPRRGPGAFGHAHGGKIFPDEIGFTNVEVQQALLRTLQDNRVRALGAALPTAVDARVLMATDANLERLRGRGPHPLRSVWGGLYIVGGLPHTSAVMRSAMQKLRVKSARLVLTSVLLLAVGCGGGGTRDSGPQTKEGGPSGAANDDGTGGSVGTAGSTGAAGRMGTAGASEAAGGTGPSDSGTPEMEVDASTDGVDVSDGAEDFLSGREDANDTSTCTSQCSLGVMRCGPNAGTQTCVAGPSTCTAWGTETSCGADSRCSVNGTEASCGCVADPHCNSATDNFCVNDTTLGTCAVDSNGCFFAAASSACPTHQSCTGTVPSAACTCNPPPPACSSAANLGTFCNGMSESDNCSQDANGCLFVTVNQLCGNNQVCGTSGVCHCDNKTCSTPGPFCQGPAEISTCTTDADGCLVAGNSPTPCWPDQNCTGAAGSAACTCNTPPSDPCAGLQAGTYCSGTGFIQCADQYVDGCISSDPILGFVDCGPYSHCEGPMGSVTCK
jgi:hypothetical protein